MAMLIAALSGRALAAAARRAGERCFVADLFADCDMVALADGYERLPGSIAAGFARAPLLDAAARWANRVSGMVYGTGFEADIDLLAALGSIVPLIGNPPDVLRMLKHPISFTRLLARLGLPHPETRLDHPGGADWLRKAAGGSGGTHIQSAAAPADDPVRATVYFQRRVAGRPASALFLGDGRAARLIGFSEQWPAPTNEMPFRYGGCAAPIRLPAPITGTIEDACAALTAATGMVGLNSLDLMIDGSEFHVLEINPRPGATLDVFDGFVAAPLWRWHCDGVAGRLPRSVPAASTGRAATVCYAPGRLTIPPDIAWPDWVADRPPAGSIIEGDDPICTVSATGASVPAAKRALRRRTEAICRRLSCPHLTPPHREDGHVPLS